MAINVQQTFDDDLGVAGDTNNDPATAPILQGSRLYVSHLVRGDIDYFRIPIGAYGSRVELTLSHIPQGSDYDLAVAGPQAPRLRGGPTGNIPLTNTQLPDTGLDLDSAAQHLPPENLQDLPLDAITLGSNTLRGVSDNRGNEDEHVTLISQGESGYYTIQVSDFSGDASDPYVLEIQTLGPPNFGPCAPRTGISNGAPAAAPAVSAATNTLFLVNESRLISTHGAAAAAVMSRLTTLAGRTDLGINGAVVRVERGAGVAGAYDAWDASPCSPALANAVVEEIGDYLDTLEAGAPNVAYKVVVGGDDIVPFARMPDETQIANERTYREALGAVNNQYVGSIGAGFLFTDDVYAEAGAPEFLGRELFVPEQAIGRLVETPADITRTIDDFIAAGGAMPPTSSYVTGYDFLTDGALEINLPFAAALGQNAKTLINETWDDAAFLAGLFPGGTAPRLNSLNAHYDHRRLLPAAESAAHREDNLVETGDITSRGANAMSGRLGFSIGCHSGLAVSDAIFGAANILKDDWAQAMLGTGATGWIGNTGYGLGDTLVVGYSERLHALLSPKLNGTMRLGQALAQAKQEYIATLGVVGPYDAKVVMQTTLYALPMLRLGTATPPGPPPALPLSTDPATGLQSADFDVSPTFTAFNTIFGKYYTADDGVQLTQRRPIEPLVSLDVTQPGLQAHGALIRLLSSPADELELQRRLQPRRHRPLRARAGAGGGDGVPDQDPARLDLQLADRPTPAAQPHRRPVPQRRRSSTSRASAPTAATRAWRARCSTRTWRTTGGRRSSGSSRRSPSPRVWPASPSTSPTWTTPAAPGQVKAVVLIYRDCAGTWRTIDLQHGTGNRYTGGGPALPSTCNEVDYYLQAVDGAGNVAVASKKVQLQPLVLPPDIEPDGAAPITSSLSGTLAPSGWYRSAVQVTLTSTDPVSYSLDGGRRSPTAGRSPSPATASTSWRRLDTGRAQAHHRLRHRRDRARARRSRARRQRGRGWRLVRLQRQAEGLGRRHRRLQPDRDPLRARPGRRARRASPTSRPAARSSAPAPTTASTASTSSTRLRSTMPATRGQSCVNEWKYDGSPPCARSARSRPSRRSRPIPSPGRRPTPARA